jgi:hypothetical protein
MSLRRATSGSAMISAEESNFLWRIPAATPSHGGTGISWISLMIAMPMRVALLWPDQRAWQEKQGIIHLRLLYIYLFMTQLANQAIQVYPTMA